MLETAASDIYTQCGLKRVICLTRIEDFIVPHLANKYYRQMGVPADDFLTQVQALANLDADRTRTAALYEPETRAPGFRWSKHLYREADEELLSLVPATARHVLSVGATTGHDEVALQQRGLSVTAVPLDPLFGATLARRGIKVLPGDPLQTIASLARTGFDVVLVADGLHLVSQPMALMRLLADASAPGGALLASVSNTSSWIWQLRDWRHGRWRWARPSFDRYGAHAISAARLRQWCSKSGFEPVAIVPSMKDVPTRYRSQGVRRLLAGKLLLRARRNG
jgi:SAM-dependent methyltransferase